MNNIDFTLNSSLEACQIDAICDFLAVDPENATIENNDTDCQSLTEVGHGCGIIAANECFLEGLSANATIKLSEKLSDFPDCEIILGSLNLSGQFELQSSPDQIIEVRGDLIVQDTPYTVHGLDAIVNTCTSMTCHSWMI